ncbi:hypothetical protein [Solibacillus daqui]|uniref:hypothetical protein n=1 Tax=Solibacillus daqui TaxID=2912187 RepID=UPI00236565B4|nr:hypothetical protein [Solibacillus daqui]
MKRIYAIFMLLLCSLLILGLSVSAQETDKPKVISFHGESENWLGAFTVEFTGERITELGYIKYKGEDVNSVGLVEVTYETNSGGLSSISYLAGLDSIDSPIGEKGTSTTKGAVGNNNQYSKTKLK